MFNTPPALSRKTKIIILVLVILLHLLLLIPFVSINFTFLPPSPLEQKVQKLHKKVHKLEEPEPEEWGTLKSRAMQMSAPVILVDDSDEAQATTDKPDADKDNDQSQEKTDNQAHDEPEADKQNINQPSPDTHDDDKAPLPEKDSTNQNVPQPILIDIPKQEGTHPVFQQQEKRPVEQKKLESKPAPDTKKPQAQPKPRTQRPTQPRPRPKNPALQRQQQKTKLSLAQLAQGFVDHMQHEGDYTIAMSGNDNAKATESQLKIGRFLQKIIGSVQNAWRCNTNRYPLSRPVIVSIHFTIVINKNGTLNKVGIDKSSGNHLIDDYIKLIVQDASTSFPAIPDYMSHDICSIRCTLDDIRLPEGPPGYTIR